MRRVRQCFERDGVGVVPLTQGHETIVDVADLPLFATHNWYVSRSLTAGTLYAQRLAKERGKGLTISAQRLIMQPPPGFVVDHINGNSLDNRRQNLRICTQSENMKNQRVHRTNRLGVKGVSKENNRYAAVIRSGGRTVYLGSYLTIAEASAAYRGAAKALYGEYAPSAERQKV